MDIQLNQVFTPVTYNDLFTTWHRYPDAVPFAGGTDIISSQDKNLISLPRIILCLDKIEELRRITRTEQYLEIGAMVKLNQLFRLGKIVPSILYKCLEQIAGVQVRNIATIGGNICASNLYDLPAVFCALDAQYELRNINSTRWVSAARFHAQAANGKINSHRAPTEGRPAQASPASHTTHSVNATAEGKPVKENKSEKKPLNKQEILTRIRLPLLQWDYSIYKKFLSKDNLNNEVLVFLAKAQKTILTDLRVVYKSDTILRNRNSEDALIGRNLPISRKTAAEFVTNWKEFLKDRDDVSEFSKNALLNNIEENVFVLSE